MTYLKTGVQSVQKGRLRYIVDSSGKLRRYRPWLSDRLAFLYDFAMSFSVLPNKLNVDIQKHYDCLSKELADIHQTMILELGTGSGSAVNFLYSDNNYTGIDISPGLLKRAAMRFARSGFKNPEFYVATADNLPFQDSVFKLCLCVLSLNFIGNVEAVFEEVNRVLVSKGLLVCAVPVPERNKNQNNIRGVLYSQSKLESICRDKGFLFEPLPCENGSLLYFRALKQF